MMRAPEINSSPAGQEFAGRDILVLGAARSGIAACHLLHSLGAHLTLVDDNKPEEEISRALMISEVTILPSGYNPGGVMAQMLVLSPGIPDTHPLVASFLSRGIPVLSEVEVAARLTSSPIIAVTGSNGKSTVTTMIHTMMAGGGFRSFLGGNIGVPFADNVTEERKLNPVNPIHVVEVSSFQAEHLERFTPVAAVFLNLSPDHLDRYPDLQSYGQAKLQIVKNMDHQGRIIYNQDDPFFHNSFKDDPRAVPFAWEPVKKALFVHNGEGILHEGERLLPLNELALPGPHNVLNFLAAATTASLMNVEVSAILEVFRHFPGLPHRLELVAEIAGVHYYNDSKATNVASTKVALASFAGNIVLILGGSDKGTTDYPDLRELIQDRVKQLITYGEAGLRLTQIFQGLVPIRFEREFAAAVSQAHQASEPGDIVLLAPACASFDQFANFEERGEAFRQHVQSYRQEVIRA